MLIGEIIMKSKKIKIPPQIKQYLKNLEASMKYFQSAMTIYGRDEHYDEYYLYLQLFNNVHKHYEIIKFGMLKNVKIK